MRATRAIVFPAWRCCRCYRAQRHQRNAKRCWCVCVYVSQNAEKGKVWGNCLRIGRSVHEGWGWAGRHKVCLVVGRRYVVEEWDRTKYPWSRAESCFECCPRSAQQAGGGILHWGRQQGMQNAKKKKVKQGEGGECMHAVSSPSKHRKTCLICVILSGKGQQCHTHTMVYLGGGRKSERWALQKGKPCPESENAGQPAVPALLCPCPAQWQGSVNQTSHAAGKRRDREEKKGITQLRDPPVRHQKLSHA